MIARKHFVIRSAVALIGLMALNTLSVEAQRPDRSTPPPTGTLPAFTIAPVQTLTLSNGLTVLFMEKHGVPLIHMNIIVHAGSMRDGEHAGLANMTASMMDEGAGPYDALTLADKIDFLGARIGVSASYHRMLLSLHTPLSKFDEALPLLSAILIEPTFPQKELDRLRKQQLTSFLQWRDEPRAIASYAYNRILFGDEHPYGIPVVGEATTVATISRDDLVGFHETYVTAANAAMVVVGDITKDALLPKLEKAFGAWKRGEKAGHQAWSAEQVSKSVVYLVDKPGAAQSEIRIGRIGVDRLSDDYYDLTVMNTILGGSFASRLNQNLREEHGYTYGARSAFSMRRLPGAFTASSAVQTDVTDKALVEFMKELNGILEPVPAEELARAKNYVALRYPENFQSVSRIASQLDDVFEYGIPDSYFDSFMGLIGEVSAADVNRVARQYITPDALAIVIVGDREKIEDGVRALELGEMKLMTIEDVLGPAPSVK
jgi:predicted Zn-dependent peptidase